MKEDNKFRVYIVNDSYLEDCFINDDIDAFTESVNDDDFISYDCEEFETEKEAMKFVEGLFYGCDEPFINALINA